MKLNANDEGALDLEEIPPFLFDLLEAVPRRAGSQDPRVENRFYPAPGEDEQLQEDWKSLVQPDLQEGFFSAREIVMADLRRASGHGDEYRMQIPSKHMEAWLNVLNQARLAIAEENHFGEKDLSEDIVPDAADPRSMLLFQISFYGFLQECLVKMQE
ncbi:MAG: DUF2017 family protein [Chthoniobacterales bacterium]|nr:DUF2017 family protein [Chthoniobacterales bacterium]